MAAAAAAATAAEYGGGGGGGGAVGNGTVAIGAHLREKKHLYFAIFLKVKIAPIFHFSGQSDTLLVREPAVLVRI